MGYIDFGGLIELFFLFQQVQQPGIDFLESYVLAHRDVDWYATEADKVALFTGPFAVPALDLPQRIYVPRLRPTPPTFRYFIHKLPIGLMGDPPVPSFVSNSLSGLPVRLGPSAD